MIATLKIESFMWRPTISLFASFDFFKGCIRRLWRSGGRRNNFFYVPGGRGKYCVINHGIGNTINYNQEENRGRVMDMSAYCITSS